MTQSQTRLLRAERASLLRRIDRREPGVMTLRARLKIVTHKLLEIGA